MKDFWGNVDRADLFLHGNLSRDCWLLQNFMCSLYLLFFSIGECRVSHAGTAASGVDLQWITLLQYPASRER